MMAKWNGIFFRTLQRQHSKEKPNYLYMMSLALAPAPKIEWKIFTAYSERPTTYPNRRLQTTSTVENRRMRCVYVPLIHLQQWMQWMRFDISELFLESFIRAHENIGKQPKFIPFSFWNFPLFMAIFCVCETSSKRRHQQQPISSETNRTHVVELGAYARLVYIYWMSTLPTDSI